MPIRDTRLISKALKQRWPVSETHRSILVKRLVQVIADPQSSPREVTAAAKGLLAAEAQNQKDEHKIVDIRISARHAELDAIAADLGLEVAAIEDAARAGTAGDSGTQGDGHAGAR